MAGRRLEQIYPGRRTERGEASLTVTGLTREGEFEDVSFTLHAGEIVGLFGLVGSGRSELARCVFGAEPAGAGEVACREAPETSARRARPSRPGSRSSPRIAHAAAWCSA